MQRESFLNIVFNGFMSGDIKDGTLNLRLGSLPELQSPLFFPRPRGLSARHCNCPTCTAYTTTTTTILTIQGSRRCFHLSIDQSYLISLLPELYNRHYAKHNHHAAAANAHRESSNQYHGSRYSEIQIWRKAQTITYRLVHQDEEKHATTPLGQSGWTGN